MVPPSATARLPSGVLRCSPFDSLFAGIQLVQIRVPEQVVGGGVDDLGAVAGLDGEVVEVGVVVDQDGGDGLGLVLAGLGVGGQDLVAGLEGGDRDGLAGGEQDQGGGGEGLPAAAVAAGRCLRARGVPAVALLAWRRQRRSPPGGGRAAGAPGAGGGGR